MCVSLLEISLLSCSLFSVSRCRLLPTVSFSVNFGYLFFFRCMYLVGFDPPTGPTNAVQLLLTLKVWGSVAVVLALVCCTMLGGACLYVEDCI